MCMVRCGVLSECNLVWFDVGMVEYECVWVRCGVLSECNLVWFDVGMVEHECVCRVLWCVWYCVVRSVRGMVW